MQMNVGIKMLIEINVTICYFFSDTMYVLWVVILHGLAQLKMYLGCSNVNEGCSMVNEG